MTYRFLSEYEWANKHGDSIIHLSITWWLAWLTLTKPQSASTKRSDRNICALWVMEQQVMKTIGMMMSLTSEITATPIIQQKTFVLHPSIPKIGQVWKQMMCPKPLQLKMQSSVVALDRRQTQTWNQQARVTQVVDEGNHGGLRPTRGKIIFNQRMMSRQRKTKAKGTFYLHAQKARRK